MRTPWRRALAVTVSGLLGIGVLATPAAAVQQAAAAEAAAFDVLVFSKTAGFRHGSIPSGIAALQKLGAANNFTVTATEDAAAFTAANLAQFEAVVFLSTTGDVLNAEQQTAFEGYITKGGGYAGIHAAADTEYDWPWYTQLVGAQFASHPQDQKAVVQVADRLHPSTEGLPGRWDRYDEWYNYRQNPRGAVHVLATLDESTYTGGSMPGDHPISWCQDFQGGRSWYTGGGHTDASFTEPQFLEHILGGVQSVAGAVPSDCGATVDANFEQVTLAKGVAKTGEPIGMAVLPDGRVLHTDRSGTVRMTKPNATTSVAGSVPVYTHDEDGVQGIAVDPNFANNGWVYLYYAPRLTTPTGDAPQNGTGPESFDAFRGHNQLSRFKLVGDALDVGTEQKILQVPADRGICCHAGGEIDFDAQGNLFLSTGDDSNPFESDGYSPLDERATRNPAFDAQRSSANTNDLRGKLLRITVNADGTYTAPTGNLKDSAWAQGKDTAKIRPEVYAMGFRNPFRMAVDKQTGWVHLGEYGPDAGGPSKFGPGGSVEFNLIKAPGNFGWPYCVGKDVPYTDRTFTGAGMNDPAGAAFNCAAPVNNSPRNTGLTELPPVQPALLPYDGGNVRALGEGSESPMGGPTYDFDAASTSATKFPEFYDGKTFNYEWGRSWIKTFTTSAQGDLVSIDPFFSSISMRRPMAVEFGQDGSLYVLDYGNGFFGGDADSAVYRIDYVKGSRSPSVKVSADKTSGLGPLTVAFSSDGTRDPDVGDTITYAWDFGDGSTSTAPNPSHTYSTNGSYTARLTVTDGSGKTGNASVNIIVGNSAPTVRLVLPTDGGLYSYGDTIPFKVAVTDPDGSAVDCTRVTVTTLLGHNEHSHEDQKLSGCEGTFKVPATAWEGPEAHTFLGVVATYDDGGNAGQPALTGTDEVNLEHTSQQAEFADGISGVQIVNAAPAEGGKRVGYIGAGSWIRYDGFDLQGVQTVALRTSGTGNATVELRAGSPTGTLVATSPVAPSGGYDGPYVTQPAVPVTDPGGRNDLFLVFKSGGMDLDSLVFTSAGLGGNARPTLTATATPVSGDVPLPVRFSADASDPEGKAVTVVWNFGDGSPTVTASAPEHTYTRAGSYTATATATDADGASTTKTVAIRATAQPPSCLTGPGSDQFDGTALDTNRWTVVRPAPTSYRVDGGALKIDAVAGDMYGGNTGAKNLVLQPAPAGAWTATTKVTMAPVQNFEQASLLLHTSDTEFLKLAFLRNSPTSRSIELIRQRAGSPDDKGAVDRSVSFPADFPSTVLLRMTSDGTQVTAAYSTDGASWTPVGRTQPLDGLVAPQIGVSAFNGVGTTASFDSFALSGKAQAVGFDDEFVGSQLDGCRWSIVNHDATQMRVADGALKLDTADRDVFGSNNSPVPNIVLQDQPGTDWTVETKVTMPLVTCCQQAGLIVYGDPGHYVKFDVIAGNGTEARFELRSEIGDVVQKPEPDVNGPRAANDTYWLRLSRAGTTYTGQFSTNGTTWTSLPAAVENASAAVSSGKVGPFALGKYQTSPVTASFDYVKTVQKTQPPVEQDTTAPVITAAVDPAPNAQGWSTSPVTVTLSAQDERPGAVRSEYRIGSGEWTTYSAPLVLSDDGQHTVAYRATDLAGNVSDAKSVQVNVDRTKPVITTGGLADRLSYGDSRSLTPTWTATDATSGNSSVTATLDGKAIAAGTTLALHELTLGEHWLVVTATDVAGNTATTTVVFTVTTSIADLTALVTAFQGSKAIAPKTATQLRTFLTNAQRALDKKDVQTAVDQLRVFAGRVDRELADVPAVQRVLRRDADAVIATLRK